MADTMKPGDDNARLRRKVLVAGVAGAAALAGAGLAWKGQRPAEDSGPRSVDAIWALDFDSPDGTTVKMSVFRQRPLLLNFWATWCPPCIEEFPLLDRFFTQNKANGWQVLGLAIDQPSAVRRFLSQTPVKFPIGLAAMQGTDLSKSLGNLSGALPFSVVFAADGSVAKRKMGRLSEQDLAVWPGLA